MKNKKLIKKETVAGKFTTVHHSIIFDDRLTLAERTVLIMILSDAESFNLTNELIIKRTRLDKKTVQKMMKSFEKNGYIIRTKLPRGFFYTISEFGNLSSDTIEKNNQPIEEPIEEKVLLIVPVNFDENDNANHGINRESIATNGMTIAQMDGIILKNNKKEGKAGLIAHYIKTRDIIGKGDRAEYVEYYYNDIMDVLQNVALF